MTSMTVGQLLRIIERTEKAIRNLNDYRGVAPALREISDLECFLRDVIGSSHMGCAEDEVILELKND